ncbi:MAG: hypothetical protein C0625_01650 [Arcobacter sp.]|nr:MAG: hypothetical protein C0625_01650 [Arcobacter sp.]
MSCYIVDPVEVELLESNIPDAEDGITQFVEGTNYDLGVTVQKGEDIFESLIANNTSIPVATTTTIDWEYVRKANKWAAFDSFNSTITTNAEKIEYVVKSRFVDTLAFIKLKALSVTVERFDLADDTFSNVLEVQTFQTFKRDVYSVYDMLMADHEYQDTLIVNLFPYFDVKLRISIELPNGIAEVGNMPYGRKKDLGLTLISPAPVHELKNLFDITLDERTGIVKKVPILPIEGGTIPVINNINQIERTKNIFSKLIGKAVLWIAIEKTENIPSLVLFGYYKRITTPRDNLKTITRNIIIEGTA